MITKLKELDVNQAKSLYELWNREYPVSLQFSTPQAFIDYLTQLEAPTHYLLQNQRQEIIGWCFTFVRTAEVWFGLLVNQQQQKKGFGRKLLEQAQKDHQRLNGWAVDHSLYVKEDGKPYQSPMNFYLKQGFTKLPKNRILKAQLRAVQIRWERE